MGDRERNEQLLMWTETALGAPLFYDEERSQQVTEQPEILEGTLRGAVAAVALREIARQRLTDRRAQAVPIEPREFSREWNYSEDTFWQMPEERRTLLLDSARQVIILNNIEESRQEHREHLRLRPDQKGAVDKITYLTSLSPNIPADNPEVSLGRGILIIRPTGSGKSALKGTFLAHAKIGQPASARDPRPLTATVITPSTTLSEQHAGRRGASTLQRAAPDIDVSLRHGRIQEDQSDIHITTIDSYVNDISTGRLQPGDATIIDETHHLLEPRMRNLLQTGKFGKLVIGFTATEKYSEERDVKQLLTYFHSGDSLVNYMTQGLLNGGQFYTFKIDLTYDQVITIQNRDALNEFVRQERDKHVVAAARQLVAEGRQIVIYCDPGKDEESNPSAHAHKIADMITKSVAEDPITDEKGKAVRCVARAVTGHSTQKRNRRTLQEFDAGDIQIITSVRSLGEGWDANVTGVIFATNTGSALVKEQQLGRGTRPNKQFPLTVYMEFLVSTFGYHGKIVSLWDILGLENIEQGYIIGPEHTRYSSSGRKTNDHHMPRKFNEAMTGILAKANLQRVSAVTISTPQYENSIPIPDDYRPLIELRRIDQNYVSDYHLITTLEKAGIERLSKWEKSEGRHRITYYYPPEAEAYIREHPAPPVRSRTDLSIEEAGELLGVSRIFIQKLIDDPESPVACVQKTTRGVTYNYLDGSGVEAVQAEIEKVPEATEGHIRVVKFAPHMSMSENNFHRFCLKNNFFPAYMRYISEETGRVRFGFHITQEQADMLIARRFAYEHADDRDMTLTAMSKAAQVPVASIRKSLPKGATGVPKISTSASLPRQSEHFPIEIAHDAIEKARKQKLPPHKVTATTLGNLFDKPSYVIRHFLDKRPDVQEVLGQESLKLQSGPPTICYSWNVLPLLISVYGWPKTPINPEQFPQDEHDGDIKRITQALKIQQAFGEQRVIRAADDIIDHQQGQPERDIEPLKPGVLPKVITVQEAQPNTPSGTYTPQHPQSMDVTAIHNFTGIPITEIENFFAKTKIAGSLPPERRVNAHGMLTTHYRGRGLTVALMTLMGISAEFMAKSRKIPTPTVKEFLEEINAQPRKNGGYDITVWETFTKAFQPPPPGWRPLATIPGDKDEISAFVRENGGTMRPFSTQSSLRELFLSPLSVLLVANQKRVRVHAPLDHYNREEIAKLAFRPVEEFDKWLHQQPAIKEKMKWAIARSGDKVLPHFFIEYVKPFITEGQKAKRQGTH